MKWDAKVICPAKINLHLEVGKRRSDGYHDLFSLFHMVDLTDTIWVRSLKTSNSCEISGNFGFPVESNLIFKALTLFTKKTGITDGFNINVEKRIPQGGGLGGGSSDAAGILRLLNKLYGYPVSDKELSLLGSSVGSDVSFFLTSAAALVTGRGEIVQSIRARPDLWCLLVIPEIKISTADAYRWLDETEKKTEICDRKEYVKNYLEQTSETWSFYNSFEIPVFKKFPVLLEIKKVLMNTEALTTGLSGSGSTIFSLYRDRESALTVMRKIEKFNVQIHLVKMLAILPDAILQ